MYKTLIESIRKEFNLDDGTHCKLFIKGSATHPLYGAYSCVKTDSNLYKLDKLEVGETWERFGSPNLTRVN